MGDDARVNLRIRAAVLLLAVAAVAVGASLFVRGPSADVPVPSPVAPLRPDLVSLPLEDFLIGTAEDSRVETLRFSATIANRGVGPLRIEARRDDAASERWRVVQWFDEPDGDPTGVVTGANLVFGGHGHDHCTSRSGLRIAC